MDILLVVLSLIALVISLPAFAGILALRLYAIKWTSNFPHVMAGLVRPDSAGTDQGTVINAAILDSL